MITPGTAGGLKTPDNPEGVDASVFEGIKKAVIADRPALLKQFCLRFYNYTDLKGKLVSEDARRKLEHCGRLLAQRRTRLCGQLGHRLPQRSQALRHSHSGNSRRRRSNRAAERTAALIKGSKLQVIQGGPHGIAWTHSDQVNNALLEFLGQAGRTEKVA